MSRPQLQRALLDAAAIFSSAANIARRAAAIVETGAADAYRGQHVSAREEGLDDVERMTASSSTAKKETTLRDNISPRTMRSEVSWPSKNASLLQRSERPPQSISAESTRENANQTTSANSNKQQVAKSVDYASREASNVNDATARADLERPAVTSEPFVGSESFPHSYSIREETKAGKPQKIPDVEKLMHDTARQQPVRPLHRPGALSSADAPQEALAEEYDATKENAAAPLRAAKVPSSRIARLLHYGSLGAGLAWGAAGSYVRGGNAEGPDGKQFMSDDNVRRLVDKLSTMRGAALKLGQFMSIQDSNLLPEQIEQVMLRVQNSAHYMPQWQMERVLQQDLGEDWRSQFEHFEDVPFASASIGQVHAATLSHTHPSDLAGKKVAVKVQFPGVRESIGSDLSNLRWLVSASALLPRGLFLDNTIRVMRRELDDECNYTREKEMCMRFGEILNNEDSDFAVPRVVEQLCSARVLTCEMMRGRPLTQASRYSQETRDRVAQAILKLSLQELFQYRLMQTDPNWTNFLYNERTGKVELIDFGATREYSKQFMDDWLCMLRAAISGDRASCIRWSKKVGYLTGEESKAMQSAHVDSMIALGEPFRPDAPKPYPFAGQTITERVRAQIPLMLRERLTPPPEPTYSLNRKLSGAFLLCARLRANVDCSQLFEDVTRDYRLGDVSQTPSKNTFFTSTRPGVRGFSTLSARRSSATRTNFRDRRLNLADRWPRHIVSAVETSLEKDERTGEGSFVSLAADPASTSIAGTPRNTQSTTHPSLSANDLIAKAVGGMQSRPSDPAKSPKTAYKGMEEVKTSAPTVLRGVSIPVRPDPPGAEDCCMSGCARCVYDLYAEDLQDYQQDLSAARAKLQALSPPLPPSQWDKELLGPRPRDEPMAGPFAESEERAKARAEAEVEAVIGRLDPSMQAFLQLERSLKKKGTHAKSNAKAREQAAGP